MELQLAHTSVNQGKKTRVIQPEDCMMTVAFRYGVFTIRNNLPCEDQDNYNYYRGRQFAILYKQNPYPKGEVGEEAALTFRQFLLEKAIT